MKKILSIIVITVLALSTQAQIKEQKKALDETMATITEMDQMLGKDFKQITTALEAVNGANFIMGECMVLGAYADEGFKKQCKSIQVEFENMFNNSNWSFEKHNPNGQSLVKVKTKAGKMLSSPYIGFQGSATIKIGLLVEGLDIDGYFYQSKTDKSKYIMMFPVSQMGVFVEMTKKDGKEASNNANNNKEVVTAINEDTKTNTTPATPRAKNNIQKTTPATTKLAAPITQPKQIVKNTTQQSANKVKAVLPIPNTNTTKDKAKNALKSKLKL